MLSLTCAKFLVLARYLIVIFQLIHLFPHHLVRGTGCESGKRVDDILFVVYTEREMISEEGKGVEVTRLISARLATNFERGLYYGKYD